MKIYSKIRSLCDLFKLNGSVHEVMYNSIKGANMLGSLELLQQSRFRHDFRKISTPWLEFNMEKCVAIAQLTV